MALTHRELCQIAYKFLKRNGFKVCFHDRFIAVTSTGEQPDAMGFRNSASCLIEAKCSRADLLADRKKRFRKNPSLGMGDWRFFISEPGIISVEDLPPGWGLLHVVNGRVRKVHGWPKGNCCWGNPDDKPFTGNTKTAVLVAREFDRKGDWRMKWATYIPGHPDANDGWVIPGASWIPSHWMPLPEPPQEAK